jgi:hypothetical protein
MNKPHWLQNDALFRKYVALGHEWERKVASVIEAYGIRVSLSKQEVRTQYSQAYKWADEPDMVVLNGPYAGEHLEVKSKKYAFDEPPWDYPHDEIWIETASSLSKKKKMPLYWLLVSRKTHAILCIPRTSFKHWKLHNDACDYQRDIKNDPTWAVHRNHLTAFSEFIWDLRDGIGMLPWEDLNQRAR